MFFRRVAKSTFSGFPKIRLIITGHVSVKCQTHRVATFPPNMVLEHLPSFEQNLALVSCAVVNNTALKRVFVCIVCYLQAQKTFFALFGPLKSSPQHVLLALFSPYCNNMASRSRNTHLQLGTRHILVCVLWIIRSVEAQNGTPRDSVPVLPTTVPLNNIRGTYFDPNGYRTFKYPTFSSNRFVLTCARSVSLVTCGYLSTLTTSDSYVACCQTNVACGMGVECDGSAVVIAGGSKIDWYV